MRKDNNGIKITTLEEPINAKFLLPQYRLLPTIMICARRLIACTRDTINQYYSSNTRIQRGKNRGNETDPKFITNAWIRSTKSLFNSKFICLTQNPKIVLLQISVHLKNFNSNPNFCSVLKNFHLFIPMNRRQGCLGSK